MKLIKAFVRTTKIDDVLRSLQEADAPGVTVSHVRGIGYDYERHLSGLAPNDLSKTEEAYKVEIVCRGKQVEALLEVLAAAARTGYRGDGIAFVTHVERAVKIRSGKEGPEALRHKSGKSKRP